MGSAVILSVEETMSVWGVQLSCPWRRHCPCGECSIHNVLSLPLTPSQLTPQCSSWEAALLFSNFRPTIVCSATIFQQLSEQHSLVYWSSHEFPPNMPAFIPIMEHLCKVWDLPCCLYCLCPCVGPILVTQKHYLWSSF